MHGAMFDVTSIKLLERHLELLERTHNAINAVPAHNSHSPTMAAQADETQPVIYQHAICVICEPPDHYVDSSAKAQTVICSL